MNFKIIKLPDVISFLLRKLINDHYNGKLMVIDVVDSIFFFLKESPIPKSFIVENLDLLKQRTVNNYVLGIYDNFHGLIKERKEQLLNANIKLTIGKYFIISFFWYIKNKFPEEYVNYISIYRTSI